MIKLNMENSKAKNRDTTFDIVRSLCIFEIVGFWHLQDYRNPVLYTESIDYYGSIITQGTLATFMLMSSVFLSKYSISSFQDVFIFWKKRFIRFFPLFFLASLLLYVASLAVGECWYSGVGNFIASLVGLTNFCPPPPPTMWYMSMLFFLYLITPAVLYFSGFKRILIATVLFFGVLLISRVIAIDDRLILYMPIYLLGLMVPKIYWDRIKNNHVILIISFVLTMLEVLVKGDLIDTKHYLILVSMPVFLISLSSYLSKSKAVSFWGYTISYASMNMYLFHRHFFLLFVFLFGISASSSLRDSYLPTWVLYVIILPIIIISSYILQKIYDLLQEKIFK